MTSRGEAVTRNCTSFAALAHTYPPRPPSLRIESLPVIERESIIAQRRDEVLSRERAAQLAGMVAAQQGRRPGGSANAKKTKKTSARKPAQRRSKAKAADSDMDQGSSDEDEDDEDSEDAGSDSDSDDYTGPATSRGGRKIKSVGSSDARNAKLAELSENRRKKAAAASSSSSSRKQSSSGQAGKASADSTSSSEESEGYVESDSDSRRQRTGRTASRARRHSSGPFIPPSLEDVNRALISRDDILKCMYRKNWQDKLIGSFVRVVADPKRDPHTGAMVPRYRAYEVVDWKKGNKWYAVDEGKYTQTLLVLAFAKEKHTKEIIYISNSAVTPDEFERYNAQAAQASKRPSKQQVLDQAEEFQDFLNEPWTEETLTQVIKNRKEARDAATKKDQREDGQDVSAAAGPAAHKATPKTEDVLLAELNARNRIADRERIQEANRRQAEIRRAAAVAAAQKASSNGGQALANGSANTTSKPSATHTPIATPTHKTTADVEIDLGDF